MTYDKMINEILQFRSKISKIIIGRKEKQMLEDISATYYCPNVKYYSLLFGNKLEITKKESQFEIIS